VSEMEKAQDGAAFELVISAFADDAHDDRARANRDLIAMAYQEMLVGNNDALFDLLDPSVEFHEAASLPYGVDCKGIDQTKFGVAGMFSLWSKLHIEILEYAYVNDIVIVYLIMTAHSRATGEVYSGNTAELFRMRDGRIIEWRPIYWDTHKVLEVCGLLQGKIDGF